MRWIYLSPHLDDAVLSAGGLIYDQTHKGIPVEIWTLMCGYPSGPEADVSPFAQIIHAQWGFSSAEETIRMRRQEDSEAAALLGADVVHFDFPDCIYRRGAGGDWLYSAVFVPPHPEDSEVPAQIAEIVSTRLQPGDVLVCQLSVGSHVDHVLVRQGAELLGYALRYDIDFPYIIYHPEELEPKSTGMEPLTLPITETGLERWKEAVLAYKSQVTTLGEAFATPEKALASIDGYWAERNGIRLLQIR